MKILLNAVQYLVCEGFNVDVLVFDVSMIRRDENKDITDELLSGLNEYVFEKTGYDIRFVEKDLDTSIDLSIYESPNNDIQASITYYKDKEEFEKLHLKIVHPPIYISIVKK
jgi:hypothetical protein